MKKSHAHITDRFLALEQELALNYPASLDEANALACAIADPRTADADDIWAHAWNKPLFSNTRVQTAARMVSALSPHMVSAWQFWGTQNSVWISRIGPGNGNAAFSSMTPDAKNVRRETNIAMYRLFAIQGAANALRERSGKSALPYADLVDTDPETAVRSVRSEMGAGWGHITVLHFLTDLGLACKPDIHLARTVRYLGIVPNLSEIRNSNLIDSIAINRGVRCLVENIYDEFSPYKLRYVDKVLMEISRKKLIGA